MGAEITRRQVLTGTVALPLLGACGTSASTPGSKSATTSSSTSAGVELLDGSFSSRFWPDQEVRWRMARPARPAGQTSVKATRGLIVALHGSGGDAASLFEGLQLGRHVAPTGLTVVAVDGGDSYWHARRSGTDTGRMVVEDLLRLVARLGHSTDRIALIGWSMGGYGALLIASRLGPRRVAGVVAVSAALWQSPGDHAEGAFDSASDFARHDVFAAKERLRAIPVRLDCGRADPFIAANQAFARVLPHVEATFDSGAHDNQYWLPRAGPQLSWLRQRLQ